MKMFAYSSILIGGSMLFFALSAGQEIEMKFSLPEHELAQMQERIKPYFQGTLEHTEYYLDNSTRPFAYPSSRGYIDFKGSLRVRFTPKGDSVCYKYRHEDENGRTLYRDEHESKVADGKAMLALFTGLGYTDQLVIKKKRAIYIVGDFELVIDQIDGVGSFVEVELKKEVGDPVLGRRMVEDFIRNILGVSSMTYYDCSYLHIIKSPAYNFGIQWQVQ